MDEIWDRVDQELSRRRLTWAWLARAIGATDQRVHNWKVRGIPRAEHWHVAQALGWSVETLMGREIKETPRVEYGVAHPLSHTKFDDPSSLTWEDVKVNKALPTLFTCSMPDDALAPDTPKGTVVLFAVGDAELVPGVGVIVEDGAGDRHVRIYRPRVGGDWIAWARNDNYPTLESKRHSLKVIAVARNRMMDGIL